MTQSGIIIQARTGSTRLSNKMLLPFYDNKGIFEIILKRLRDSSISVPIVVATTTKEADNPLVKIAKNYGFDYYRGYEDNVLNRFIETADCFKIDNIIRLCADNPLIDMKALQQQINAFDTSFDYWCYCNSELKPTIKTGYGLWTEMVTLDALKRIASYTEESLYQEHVTNYIYTHSDNFKIHFEKIDPRIEEVSDMRLTVDTQNDFELLKEIYETLISKGINFTALEISNMVKQFPQWLKVMKAETQKNIK